MPGTTSPWGSDVSRYTRPLVFHLSVDEQPEVTVDSVDVVRYCDGRWSVSPAPSSPAVSSPAVSSPAVSSPAVSSPAHDWAASLVAGANWVGRIRVTQIGATTWRLERHRDLGRRRCP